MLQDNTSQVIPVILSGGSGSRLWPKSRQAYPKQLHTLYGDCTMLQHTYNRVRQFQAPIVVCNEAQRFMVADQMSEVCDQKPTIILEPLGKNTAPAIAVAAQQALTQDESAVLVVLPADHQIKNTTAFILALDIAIERAQNGSLVAFGVVPLVAETGYGYIKALIEDENGAEIRGFVEKPNAQNAEKYVQSGEFFWNSGIFVFSAKVYIEELKKYEPNILAACECALSNAEEDLDFIRLQHNAYSDCKDISVDYAVMERTDKAWCVPLDCGWSDVGSWQALWESAEKDEHGNALMGDVMTIDCQDSLFKSENRLIAAVGLRDLVVVDTDDAILVVNRTRTQDVKCVVNTIKKNIATSSVLTDAFIAHGAAMTSSIRASAT